jgi:hypothetical protein
MHIGRVVCIFAALSTAAGAEHIARGTIRDAQSGAPLPAATVQIVDTYRATIANAEGQYALRVSALPARVRVVCIGYHTMELAVDTTQIQLDFNLQAAPYELPETIVQPQLGRELMRKVIARKAEWMPRIESYSTEVYTRRTIQRREEIIELHEIVSDVYWNRTEGTREVITSMRKTRNHGAEDYVPALAGLVNLYHDDIEFAEAQLMGVTHPDALDHYNFQVIDHRRIDGRTVYDLSVEPKSRLHYGFTGMIAILDEEFALVEANLEPTRATVTTAIPLPLIEDFAISYRQQFRSFDALWLPVDYHLMAKIEIGMVGLQFPLIQIEQVTRFADYKVNVTAADSSVFAETEELRIDSAAVAADTAFTRFADPVPMTEREAVALDTISADFSIDKALRPSGFLTRFMNLEAEVEFTEEEQQQADQSRQPTGEKKDDSKKRRRFWSDFSPDGRFNRVEEAQLMLEFSRALPEGTTLGGSAGFSSGLRRWSFKLKGQRTWDLTRGNLSFATSYHRGGGSHYTSATYPIVFNSLQVLLGEDDYFDYYWVDGFGADLSYSPGSYATTARIGWRAEEHASLASTTGFDLLDRRALRPNPTVDAGRMHRLELAVQVGGDYARFGLEPNRRLAISFEHSAEWMGGDFDFSKLHFEADWHQPTFQQRRWVPNALDFRVVGGTHWGRLPVQRFGALDVAMGPLSPYGALRGVRGHPYVGESYFGAVAEHNFRTTPFELLGLWPLVRRGFGLLVHGGYGQTWIGTQRRAALPLIPRWTKTPHKELGLSLFLYHMARIDLTRRIDSADWAIGVSAARFAFD